MAQNSQKNYTCVSKQNMLIVRKKYPYNLIIFYINYKKSLTSDKLEDED